jgi:hypothetical protein
MRRGREVYSGKFERAVELGKQGKSVKEIARELGVSYSAAYHWVKGLRKPAAGSINEFIDYLRENGPMPAERVSERFPKHGELFLTAQKRGAGLRRHMMSRQFRGYRAWYYLDGQEGLLQQRLDELFDVIRKIKGASK